MTSAAFRPTAALYKEQNAKLMPLEYGSNIIKANPQRSYVRIHTWSSPRIIYSADVFATPYISNWCKILHTSRLCFFFALKVPDMYSSRFYWGNLFLFRSAPFYLWAHFIYIRFSMNRQLNYFRRKSTCHACNHKNKSKGFLHDKAREDCSSRKEALEIYLQVLSLFSEKVCAW